MIASSVRPRARRSVKIEPCSAVMALILVACCVPAAQGQTRDAERVLADMREALGGSAVLDGIQSFTNRGTVVKRVAGRTRQSSLELFAVLPDHFLEIQRDRDTAGPMEIDVTYYRGLRGDTPIRRTDSNIPFPPDPLPQTPEAIAERRNAMTLAVKQELARLELLLLGRSSAIYPLVFSYAGTGTHEGRAVEIIAARAADGFTMRLGVDAATHLPAVLWWTGPLEVVMTTTTTSRVAVDRGGSVVSRSPPQVPEPPPVPPPPAGAAGTERVLVVSGFRREDGVNWPRQIKETTPNVETEYRLGRYRLNQKIDPRRFDIR